MEAPSAARRDEARQQLLQSGATEPTATATPNKNDARVWSCKGSLPSEDVSVMPGARNLNAAVYRTAIMTVAELLENAYGAGARNFQLFIIEDVGGKQVLVFADDAHGVEGPLAGIFQFGNTEAELAAAREQNRMFHRGLVLALDSLGDDVFVFSRSEQAEGGAAALHLARYGPTLNAWARRRTGNPKLATQTLSMQLDADGRLLYRGAPAAGDELAMLLDDSVFGSVDALRDFIDARFAERSVGAAAPGFVGAIVLKPGLGIKAAAGDIVQRNTSLRDTLRSRYVPAGVSLSGVTAPKCTVQVQHERLQLPAWDSARSSPLFKTVVRLATGACDAAGLAILHEYSVEMRIMDDPDAAAAARKQPASEKEKLPVDWTPPRLVAVFENSCIAVNVPLETQDKLVSQCIAKQQVASWSYRSSDGRLDGHERFGFSQLAQLNGHGANAQGIKVGPTDVHVAPAAAPRRTLSAEQYARLNKASRALLVGCGTRAVASLKPLRGSAGFDASDLLSADKLELRNETLAKQIRLLHAQALVLWQRGLFVLRYGADAEPRFEAVVVEEEEERAAAVQEQQRKTAAEKAAVDALRREDQLETKRRERAQKKAEADAKKADAAKMQRNIAAAALRNAARAAAAAAAAAADDAADAAAADERHSRRRGRAASLHDLAEAGAEEEDEHIGDDAGAPGPSSKRARRSDAPVLPSHCYMCQQAMDRRTASAALQRREEEHRELLRSKEDEIELLKHQLNVALGRE